MKYCPISTTFRNPASIQNLLNLSCCDNFSIRSPYFCNRRSLWARSSQSKGTCLLITLSTSEALDCPPTTGCPVRSWRVSYSSHIALPLHQYITLPWYIVKGFIFFTYVCDCSVKTELIYRNNCAKNSFNRVLVGTIVDRQFSTAFALELTSGQWTGLVARKTGCPLSANVNIIFSAIWSHSPCGLSSLTEYHVFSDPDKRNDHCPAPNLFANRGTSWAFDSHSTLLSFDPHEMSLNIDMKMILPLKFSGVSFDLNNNSWNSWLSCNVLNPGKIFHSNSIGSPSILSKVLYSGVLLNHSNLCYHAVFGWGSRVSYQDTIQNLKRRRPLCAEDWLTICSSPKTNTSMKKFPNQLFSLHRSHLVQTPISQICRTFVSLWDLLYSWWNANCLSNSFPWVQMIPMLRTWTFTKSQNVFRCLL